MKRLFGLLLIALLGFILINAHAADKTKKDSARYVEQFYYDNEEMFLCSVTNTATQQTFYGQSPKQSLATMYARAACQMQSYQGQCYIKANCNWEWVKVRKRRYIKST